MGPLINVCWFLGEGAGSQGTWPPPPITLFIRYINLSSPIVQGVPSKDLEKINFR